MFPGCTGRTGALCYHTAIRGKCVYPFFEVERDYSVPPEKVRTDIQEVECFFFSKGRPRRFSRYWYSYMASYWTKCWSEIQCSQERLTDYNFYPSPADVMEGTVLQHCHMNDYIRLCEKRRAVCKPVKYLITYARHPGIEHLMGAGLDRLVYQLVNGANGLGLVNWKGRRPRDMLGLTEPEVKTAAKNGYMIHDIDMWKKLRPGGISLEDSQTITAFVTLTGDRLEHVKKIGLPESAKYLKHVVEKDKSFTLHNAAQYWVDAWKMAEKLGYDMTVAEYRFPPKLRSFHDRLVELDQPKAAHGGREKAGRRSTFMGRTVSASLPSCMGKGRPAHPTGTDLAGTGGRRCKTFPLCRQLCRQGKARRHPHFLHQEGGCPRRPILYSEPESQR